MTPGAPAPAAHSSDTTPPVALVVAAGAVLACLFAVQVHTLDFWWHLATGAWIVEHRKIPSTDPFSYTVRGAPWRDVNWMGDLVLYGAFRAGGPAGVVAWKVANAGILLSSLGLCLREIRIGRAVLLSVLVIAAVLIQPRFCEERPEAMGGALTAVQLWLGSRHWSGKRHALVPLAATLFLWFFVHPSFLVGAASAFALLLTFVVERRSARERLSTLALVLGVATLLFATSRGREVIGHARAYDEASWVVRLTEEWTRVRLRDARVQVPCAFLALGVVGAASSRRARTYLLPVALIGAALGTRYLRNIPFGVLLTAPGVAALLQRGVDGLRARSMSTAARLLPPAFAALVPGLHGLLVDDSPILAGFGFSTNLRGLPHDTLRELVTLPFGRTLNDLGIGGYLIHRQIPGGVFFDGRTVQVYTERDLEEMYLPILQSPEGLDHVADRWDATYGLVNSTGAEARVMMTSPEWVPVLHGRSTSLFVRRARAAVLGARAADLYPLIRWVDEEAWNLSFYSQVLSDPARRQELEKELVRALRAAPDGYITLATSAFLERQAPDLAASVERQVSITAGPRR